MLHLVQPLGFSIDDRQLKRAGLDYWDSVDLHLWQSLDELWLACPHGRFFYLSTKVSPSYLTAAFQPGDFIVFGKETKGLPEELLHRHSNSAFTIPMPGDGGVRSLNLSSSAAIVLYEALRQTGRLG